MYTKYTENATFAAFLAKMAPWQPEMNIHTPLGVITIITVEHLHLATWIYDN